MKAQFDLADGRVNVKNLRIAATDYSTQGSGWVELERKVNFRATLAFSQRLSADIGDSAREMKFLFNTQNQIEIPFTISGKLPKVKPKPDMNLLGRMVQKGFLRRGPESVQRPNAEPRNPSPDPAHGLKEAQATLHGRCHPQGPGRVLQTLAGC
jgi:hypothetical protein